MAPKDKRKQSLYFSDKMLHDIRFEAARLDRSLSWLLQKAWKMARSRIVATPGANDAPTAVVGDPRDADPNEY